MAEEKKIATGYIGNALRSAAADHTTTFADEIFDTERQKYQNEVTADLETTDNEIKADLEAESVRAKAVEEANAQAINTLKNKTSEITNEVIMTEEDYISIEDNNGNEVFYLDENGLDAKNVKSNGKDVLTEHQDISGLATKEEVENVKVKEISSGTTTETDSAIIITDDNDKHVTDMHTAMTYDTEECQSWNSDDYREQYAKVTPEGIHSKKYLDMNGNVLIGESKSIIRLYDTNNIVQHSYINGSTITATALTQVMWVAFYAVKKDEIYHISELGHTIEDGERGDATKAIFCTQKPSIGVSGTIIDYEGNYIDIDFKPNSDGWIAVWQRNRYATQDVSIERYVDVYQYSYSVVPVTPKRRYEGKLMTCLGDSLTSMRRWQPFAQELLGCNIEVIAKYGGTLCNNYMNHVTEVNKNSDIITFAYGSNDWISGNYTIGSIDDMADGTTDNVTFYGAMNYVCKWFSENVLWTNPYCRILLLTQPIRRDGGVMQLLALYGRAENGDIKNSRGNTLTDFADAIINIAKKWRFAYLDLHRESQINEISLGKWNDDYVPSASSKYDDYKNNYIGNYYIDGTHPDFLPTGKILGEMIGNKLLTL